MQKKAIVIGAGIVGLAVARSLAIRNYAVSVFEKNTFSVGASIRNFGMIWPIGQTEGKMYERAITTRNIWSSLCEEAGIWKDNSGSFHLAYSDLEMEVLSVFYERVQHNRPYVLMSAKEVLHNSNAVNSHNLKGGLYSPDELIVDSPLAIAAIPGFLTEKYGVQFFWQRPVQRVETSKVYTSENVYEADEVFICSGPDFETLFPEKFAAMQVTKCKLQMMKTVPQTDGWKLGPSLCGGLSLTHYSSFQIAGDSLDKLKEVYRQEQPDYIKWGIHVMVSQNSRGELVIGDSHEYGPTHDPFDKAEINELIIRYLSSFLVSPASQIAATWNGIYTKRTNGETELVLSPLPGVTIVNGLGGAGMTLSFGLAEEIIDGRMMHS
jgi:FAD dependent oxidoreductase TIGR03364